MQVPSKGGGDGLRGPNPSLEELGVAGRTEQGTG